MSNKNKLDDDSIRLLIHKYQNGYNIAKRFDTYEEACRYADLKMEEPQKDFKFKEESV